MVCHSIQYGMVWYGMVWYGMVQYGMVGPYLACVAVALFYSEGFEDF